MTGIIILAAGASTRLGRAKQSLPYKDKSLLGHAIDAAVKAVIGPVIIVVGANEKEIRSDLGNEHFAIVTNKNWKDGMASSIQAGLNYFLKCGEDAESVILMVCDQPYVDENLLKRLIETSRTANKPIVACSYKDTVGVPALFDRAFFPELLSLKGDEGGKKVLLKHKELIAVIPFPKGAIDIDTVADYEALSK